MFAAPQEIETEVFASLPDSLRITDRTSQWVEFRQKGSTPAHSPLVQMDSYLEGPSFDKDGNLYCTDIPYGRIFRVSPDGVFTVVAEYDGNPYGLKIHKDGRIFICDHKNGIVVLNPDKGEVKPVVFQFGIEHFKGVNDLVFASNGDLYFTDMGASSLINPTGRVFRLRSDGELELLLNNVPGCNGLVLNPNETLLFVAAMRANAIWQVPLQPSGGITQAGSKVGVFIHLTGGLSGPDGLAVDEEGSLAICQSGFGSVWLFSKWGEPLYRIRSCKGVRTTNLAYGGPERKMLYITEAESGTILRAKMPVPGHLMYSHM